MANWIKVEVNTPQKPEIAHIARLCGCSKAEAFLAFFRFFVWADENTENGHIQFLTPEDADEHSALQGFGKAAEVVGWVLFNNEGAMIQNWDRHNGSSTKRRHIDAERHRRWRANNPTSDDALRKKPVPKKITHDS